MPAGPVASSPFARANDRGPPMRWSNVFVIFQREVRDLIRDRRTLFMIFVLPILLYPLLGIGIIQLQVAFEHKPKTVVVVGPEHLPSDPPLLNAHRSGFDASLLESLETGRLLVSVEPARGAWLDPEIRGRAIQEHAADAVVTIPSDLRERLDRIESEPIPIAYDSINERSAITYVRLKDVIANWKKRVVASRLTRDKLPPSYTEPIQIKQVDVAPKGRRGVNIWARLFPFLLVMMSLTGAFYPAVDLCAGEKERGTMETLLISPASRAEIVMGKFLTIVLASMMTALLNLLSMGLTGVQLAHQAGAMTASHPEWLAETIAPPGLLAAFWMVLLLVPLSVFFSAICLALAMLARSMKEGQYYMTPLYLVCLPLIFLTLAPGIELNLFYSLVPVTGVSLLLRALILGEYAVAWRFFLPVLVPTLIYGAIALRWAIDQIEREDVLFREAERFDFRMWVRHLLRDKEPTPNGGEALFCFALMITLEWFLMQSLATSGRASSLTGLAAGQVGVILAPPLAMTLLLTSDPRQTLRLSWPRGRDLALAVALPLALNPLVRELGAIVDRLFPMSVALREAFGRMMGSIPNIYVGLLLLALVPAVCEEFAFRGFILSGLLHGHRRRTAIVMSALLFGFLHVLISLFQQLFNATLLGIILGMLAIRSGSILPGIVFHFLNNGLAVAQGSWLAEPSSRPIAVWLYRDLAEGHYHWWWIVLSALISGALVVNLRDGEPLELRPGRVAGGPDEPLVAMSDAR